MKPSAVLLTGFNYKYDLVAYWSARRQGVPVWLRCETQDHALKRSPLKAFFRSIVYKCAYLALDRVFYIGELNKLHYRKHLVEEQRLRPARYGTADRFSEMDANQKMQLRTRTRQQAGIKEDAFVVGFSGKFIPKKHPDILFEMLSSLPSDVQKKTHLYFMGSGELEGQLRAMAEKAERKYGVKTFFSGFVNQSQLAAHYLAMDVMVLPSRKMGETWGLVANEAMQSGCGVVVSDAVGCGKDFKDWERFRVFSEENPEELATQLNSLSRYQRNFDWASEALHSYSIFATAQALLKELKN